jgi:preprotein translocase subunit SecA
MSPLIQDAIRSVVIRKIDELWQEHLLTMDHLRAEVNLRTVGQKDPLLEFKHEAFRLFHELTRRLQIETARNLFKLEVVSFHPVLLHDLLNQIHLESNRLIFDALPEIPPSENRSVSPDPEAPAASQPIVSESRTGRNDPCPCKSGKKYKKCCGISNEEFA